jgi:hypothetical protein
LNENIMRFMVTRVDPRLVDTLVAHALGKVTPPPRDVEVVAVGVGDDLDVEDGVDFDPEDDA